MSVKSKLQQSRPGKGWWEIEGTDLLLTYFRISTEIATGKSLQASGDTSRLSDEDLIQMQRKTRQD